MKKRPPAALATAAKAANAVVAAAASTLLLVLLVFAPLVLGAGVSVDLAHLDGHVVVDELDETHPSEHAVSAAVHVHVTAAGGGKLRDRSPRARSSRSLQVDEDAEALQGAASLFREEYGNNHIGTPHTEGNRTAEGGDHQNGELKSNVDDDDVGEGGNPSTVSMNAAPYPPASLLSSLPRIDELRERAGASANSDSTANVHVRRLGNVDFLSRGDVDTTSSTSTDAGSSTSSIFGNLDELALCHLAYLMPFTRGADAEKGRSSLANTYKGAAAVLLAAQHLNVGNGTVVPEVEGLSDRCPIRFTVEMFDTELSEGTAINHVIQLTDRDLPPERRDGEGDGDGDAGEVIGTDRPPCAFLGAGRSAVSIPSSIISGLRGYPQVSPISTSAALDNPNQYPLFARTIPADDGTAVPIVLYLRNVLGMRHLAVLHVTDSYGTSFARGLQRAAEAFTPDLHLYMFDVPFNVHENPDVVERSVQSLVDAQNLMFFAILFPDDADAIMTEAYRRGIAGTGTHNWFFADAIGSGIKGIPYGKDSALGRAYRGTAVLQAMGGMDGMPVFDALTRAVQDLDTHEDLSYLQSVLPVYPDEGEGLADVHNSTTEDGSFLSSLGAMGPFLYDATIALGLAACEAAKAEQDSRKSGYFYGKEHFDAMLKTSFEGSSGNVMLDSITGTRSPESALFSLVNFVEDEDNDLETAEEEKEGDIDTVTYKAVQTHVFRNGEWIELIPFTFNDATSDIPLDLPPVSVTLNYLSPALRGTGLALCAVILLLSISFVTWTYRHRASRPVRASQPIFLNIICVGTFITGASIIPLSIHRGVASESGCDAACMAFPWLLSIGFSLTFSGLHAKTHRVNRIFRNPRFKRITVTPQDVLTPMIIIMGANIIVLSLWTALFPLQREIVVVSTDRFARSTETYGVCLSENYVPFVATLGVLNLGALTVALYEAYQARGLSTEYSESSYIMKAVACMLLVCFIGIPVVIIAKQNPSAYFFVFTGIIFVTCCCLLLLIFVPKIRHHRKGEWQKKTGALTAGTGSADANCDSQSKRSSLSAAQQASDRQAGTRIMKNPYIEALESEVTALKASLALMEQSRPQSEQKVEAPESSEESLTGSCGEFASNETSETKHCKSWVESDEESLHTSPNLPKDKSSVENSVHGVRSPTVSFDAEVSFATPNLI